jgi:DNA invertase Pin-like site-specific DNA recombinase
LLESLLEGLAEYYSVELAVKVKRGQTENALKAKHNGGPIPFGLKLNSEREFEPDPMTAPIVKEVFERYADGESVQALFRI